MSVIELKVPDIGNVSDVEVIEVLIQPGDVIELEQTVLTMESDKATMDMPSSIAGTVQEVKVNVGDKVGEGSLVATVSVSAEAAEPAKEEVEQQTVAVEEVPEPVAETTPAPAPKAAPAPAPVANMTDVSGKAHASPSVRRFARELGVDINLISAGSGRKGRVLQDDVKNFVKQAMTSGTAATGGSGIPPIPEVDFSKFGEVERQPLNKIKKLTAQGMTRAWLNLPMVTHHDEADITEMEAFRKTLNAEHAKTGGVKVTPLVFVIKALVSALKQYSQFNTSLSADGSELIYKKYINIGIAVDTPGGLVVPVIKNADKKSLIELCQDMAELSSKARDGKLMPADMQGGSMTISSLGGIGGTAFTPIVNAPEVAILGVTRAAMKPVWNGEEFTPRLIVPLDLTYDHRVIDGADGARFMVAISQYLSDIRRLLL